MYLKSDKDGFLIGKGGKDALEIALSNTEEIKEKVNLLYQGSRSKQIKLPKTPVTVQLPKQNTSQKLRDDKGRFISKMAPKTPLEKKIEKNGQVSLKETKEINKNIKKLVGKSVRNNKYNSTLGGGLLPLGGLGLGKTSKASKLGKFAKFGKRLPLIGGLLGLVGLGSELSYLSGNKSLTYSDKRKKTAGAFGGAFGGFGGMAAGAAAGAGIGSIVPGIGTAIGGVVGGVLGGLGGDKVGRTVGEWLADLNWHEVPKKADKHFATASSWIKTGWDKVKDTFNKSSEFVKTRWSEGVKFFEDKTGISFTEFSNAIENFKTKTFEWFNSAMSWTKNNIFTPIKTNVINPAFDGLMKVWNKIKEAGDTAYAAFKQYTGYDPVETIINTVNSLRGSENRGNGKIDQSSSANNSTSKGDGEINTNPNGFDRHPLDGKPRVTSGFGKRKPPTKGASSQHNGVDYGAPSGTPVYVPSSGTIERFGYDKKGGGNYAVIKHDNGYTTKYLHMSEHGNYEKGQRVNAGDLVGRVGNTGVGTGPHLDWRVMKDGKYVDPETMKFLPNQNVAKSTNNNNLSTAAKPTKNKVSSKLTGNRLGSLSAKHEGKVESANKDNVGFAYGKYQFNSATGGLNQFFNDNPSYAKQFNGLTPGSKEFNSKWREIANTDRQNFEAAQEKSATNLWYKPAADTAKNLGFDMSNRGVQEAIFSGSIQHGKLRTKLLPQIAKKYDLKSMSPEEQIKAFYKERTEYTRKHAGEQYTNRYKEEMQGALEYSKEPKKLAVAQSQPVTVNAQNLIVSTGLNFHKTTMQDINKATAIKIEPVATPTYQKVSEIQSPVQKTANTTQIPRQELPRRVSNEQIAWIVSGGIGMGIG